jgi:hypothetical protein
MFVRLRDFKRLIKEAYTGAGLYVARRGNQLLFGGSYWAIATTKESLDKKALAAVIELTGEMPEDGGAFKATKEANQYEIEGPFINRHFPKQVYWRSEATTLTAFLFDRDDMKEKDLLDYLQNTKIEG